MRYRIVVYRNKTKGHWWWALDSAGNNHRLATSETYTTRAKAFKTADALAAALGIKVEDQTPS